MTTSLFTTLAHAGHHPHVHADFLSGLTTFFTHYSGEMLMALAGALCGIVAARFARAIIRRRQENRNAV